MEYFKSTVVAWGCLLGAIVAPHPLSALTVDHNVNFAAVNRDPWTGGPRFTDQGGYSFNHGFNVELPGINANPLDILANFIGIPLPKIAGANVGGRIAGNAGFSVGYYVSGGNLDVTYPAQGKLDFQTLGDTNRVALGRSTAIQTQFLPGLNREYTSISTTLALAAGLGYSDLANSGAVGAIGGATTFQAPMFTTEFPYASAWANFNFAVGAGVGLKGELLCLGVCLASFEKNISITAGDSVDLVEIDPGKAHIAGLGTFDLLNNKFSLPFGTLELNYPDVKVKGTLQPDGTLAGDGSELIIALRASLDDLIPIIGPFLDGSVGPFGYTLLSADGGPQVSLYQDMQFQITPQLTLAFNQPVEVFGADGNFHIQTELTVPAGETPFIRPLFGNAPELVVRPTYRLDNQFTNETGLQFDFAVHFEGLGIRSPIADLGPISLGTLSTNGLFQVPVFAPPPFELPVPEIAVRRLTFEKVVPFVSDPNAIGLPHVFELFDFENMGDGAEPGTTEFLLRLHDLVTDAFYEKSVVGRQSGSFDDGQWVLQFDEDQLLNVLRDPLDPMSADQINLGSAICLFCEDLSFLFGPDAPSLFDMDDELYFSPLFEFDSGEYCIECDPLLSRSNLVAPAPLPLPVVSETMVVGTSVPEPSAVGLIGLGAAAIFGMRRSMACRGCV